MEKLTGVWENRIFGDRGKFTKKDNVELSQQGDLVTGRISRSLPPDQAHRRWKLVGKLVGNSFVAAFWSDNPDIVSFGAWFLERTGDAFLSGHYLKLDRLTPGPLVPVKIEMVKKEADDSVPDHDVKDRNGARSP